MARKIIFSEDEFYHIYNRGTDKRIVFNNEHDKKRFLKLLYLCNGDEPFHFRDLATGQEYQFDRGKELIKIIAYCLMDNHYHLILKEIKEGGISAFMHKLGVAYSKYFNKLNERSGNLFESKFNAKHLDNDEYLKYSLAYVHLNPVKIIEPKWKEEGIKNQNQAKDFLNRYYYSSYLDYLNSDRRESCILDMKALPEYFENQQEFEGYLNDWLNYSEPFST